jgi:hypothetical protein
MVTVDPAVLFAPAKPSIAQRHLAPTTALCQQTSPPRNFGSKAGPPHILSIGRDASKLSTRAYNLSSATGCSVKSAAAEAVSNLVIANFYAMDSGETFSTGLCVQT